MEEKCMNLRNDESKITYEVVLRGKEKEQTYDLALRNFFKEDVKTKDYVIRENMPLPGGLVHASKDDILGKLFDDVKTTAYQYQERAKNSKDEQEKNENLAMADALESLDYDKLNKIITREK